MNDFQTELYNNLMALCQDSTSEAFYYVDQVWDGRNYRIFLYRLASYTEFQKPSALECRGHTFSIDEDGNPLELVSLPPQKFFNLGENPFVMDLDLSGIDYIMDKLDGSLISTVKVGYNFILKSKGSLNSTQARDATRLLNTEEYKDLRWYCDEMSHAGATVNLEYMAPDNRIVIGYDRPTLKILNVRWHKTGNYANTTAYTRVLDPYFIVDTHPIPENPEAWIKEVYQMTGIEGFVVRLRSGLIFKIKVIEYVNLHGLVSNLNSPRNLFELIVSETTDDIIPLIANNQYLLELLESESIRVREIYNTIHKKVHEFYEVNKALDRKSFALLGQVDSELMNSESFGLVMNLYSGKELNLKQFMIKKYDKFKAPVVAAEQYHSPEE